MMTARRLLVGLSLVFSLSVWSWVRADTHAVEPTPATEEAVVRCDDGAAATGGNYDDSARRFRSNQSRHWRHVMIGGR